MKTINTIYGKGIAVGRFENSGDILMQIHFENLRHPEQGGDPDKIAEIQNFIVNRKGLTLNLDVSQDEIISEVEDVKHKN